MVSTASKDRLRDASQGLVGALSARALGGAGRKVSALTDRMQTMASEGGVKSMPKPDLSKLVKPGLSMMPKPDLSKLVKPGLAKLTGGSESSDEDGDGGSSGNGDGSSTKVTTIIEQIDVGVPISLAYNQWTEFGSFPSFMKKVENVDAVEDQRLKWKAQILWSHREWESTILEQKPEERIVWKSEGSKGYVDGAVTFHELTPGLTRIIVVLEYHPQGLFERTGNIWRAQGRRVRAELQHFRRHVMAHAVLDPDRVQGWRGVIEDAEVVSEDGDEGAEDEGAEDEADEQPEDEEPEDLAEDEGSEEESDEEPEEDEDLAEDEEPEDEASEEEEPDDEASEDEEPEDVADEDEEPAEDEEPEDEASEDEEPEDEASEDEEPEDEASEDEEPEDEASEDEDLDEDEAPEDEEPDDEASEDVADDEDEYADDDSTEEIDDEYEDEDEEDAR
jgi:uncharacterized membrane protein